MIPENYRDSHCKKKLRHLIERYRFAQFHLKRPFIVPVQRSDDLITKQFYESDCITGIFVNKSFRQSAYDERECFQAAEDTEELVRSPLEPKSWRLSEIIAIRESAAQAECCKLS